MPRTFVEAHKLLYLAIAIDHKVGRYSKPREISKTRVLSTIQLASEQPLGSTCTVLALRQRDAVHYNQFGLHSMRPRVAMGARSPYSPI